MRVDQPMDSKAEYTDYDEDEDEDSYSSSKGKQCKKFFDCLNTLGLKISRRFVGKK